MPAEQPRYLMGLGDPIGIVEVVALGIDLFDCVLPTRFARHGTILSGTGRYNLKRAENATDDAPLDATCGCPVCARWSRAYLRHLCQAGEMLAAVLLTQHNLRFFHRCMEAMRTAIERAGVELDLTGGEPASPANSQELIRVEGVELLDLDGEAPQVPASPGK